MAAYFCAVDSKYLLLATPARLISFSFVYIKEKAPPGGCSSQLRCFEPSQLLQKTTSPCAPLRWGLPLDLQEDPVHFDRDLRFSAAGLVMKAQVSRVHLFKGIVHPKLHFHSFTTSPYASVGSSDVC